MREIKASEKVAGKRRQASVEAAKRRIRDGGIYLIRRHGGFFRPDAQGYTIKIADAGLYTAEQARSYLGVEGLSVVPLASLRERIRQEAEDAKRDAEALLGKLTLASLPVP